MVDLAYARTLPNPEDRATARVKYPVVWINHACKTSPIYVMTPGGKFAVSAVAAFKLAEDLLRSVRCTLDPNWE